MTCEIILFKIRINQRSLVIVGQTKKNISTVSKIKAYYQSFMSAHIQNPPKYLNSGY
jgi:hypothetical protein